MWKVTMKQVDPGRLSVPYPHRRAGTSAAAAGPPQARASASGPFPTRPRSSERATDPRATGRPRARRSAWRRRRGAPQTPRAPRRLPGGPSRCGTRAAPGGGRGRGSRRPRGPPFANGPPRGCRAAQDRSGGSSEQSGEGRVRRPGGSAMCGTALRRNPTYLSARRPPALSRRRGVPIRCRKGAAASEAPNLQANAR